MIVLVAPGASEPTSQVKFVVLVVVSQVTPTPKLTVPRVKPAGHVSDRLMPAAVEGPALLTTIVYV